MFGWLSGKSKKETLDKSVGGTEQPVPDKLDLTMEIQKAVELSLTGAHPSLLYAKAAGYPSDTIDYDNILDFTECLRVNHHALKGESAESAKEWFVSNIEFSLKCDVWQHMFFRPTEYNEDNQSKNGFKEIQRLRGAVTSKNINLFWGIEGQTIGDYALEKAIEFKRNDLEKILSKLEERKDALKPLFSRSLAAGKNKYGEIDYDKYFDEINDFFEYFFPEGELNFYFSVKPLMETSNYIDKWFEDGIVDTSSLPEDGIEFEHWCAAKLEEQGWYTRVSQASGDQGVDIEARQGDYIVAVQCKRYTKPVGNKAVQEVYTGAKNINATAAAVIGTGGYTRSALAVASTTAVELFDASEIGSFSERFGFEPMSIDASVVLRPIHVEFSSTAERMLALMFRTVLNQFDITDLNVGYKFKKSFFEEIDERGVGALDFDATELGSVLIFSNFVFRGSFKLTQENIASLEKHNYPNLERLKDERVNDDVFIFELIGEEYLNEVKEVFVTLASKLPVEIDLDEHFLFSE